MRLLLPASLLALVAAGCDSGTEDRRDTTATRTVMRPSGLLPEGSVPRTDLGFGSGKGPALTPVLLRRGREAYAAFCTPCHGPEGGGDGPVVQRGFPTPPALSRLAGAERAPGRIVEVIAKGQGRMRPMAEQVGPADAWGIAYYVSGLTAPP